MACSLYCNWLLRHGTFCAGDRTGVWEQGSGTLTVTLQQTLKPVTSTVRLSFVLRQPAAAQDARVPKAIMIGMLPQDLSGSVLGGSGVAAVASFSVHESGRVEGEENQLTFRFAANVPIMQGVELTLTGLAGRLEACAGVTTVAALGSASPAIVITISREYELY